MTGQVGFVTGGFYHSLTPPAVATTLPALVTAFQRASQQADLLRYAVAVSQKPSPVVSKGLDKGALERLGSAVREGQLLSIDLCERAPSDPESEASTNLRLTLMPKRVASQPVEVPFQAVAFFPRRVVISTDALAGALSEMADVLRASYAFIHAGRDAEMVKQEGAGLAATHFYATPSPEERERVARLEHVQAQRQVLGSERIRGAYWGTFLAPHFVERLGGLTRVRDSAPVEKVEELSSGTAYLQLTTDVWDYERADFPEKLASLERYLEPISLLSIERIVTPRMARWDRSTRT